MKSSLNPAAFVGSDPIPIVRADQTADSLAQLSVAERPGFICGSSPTTFSPLHTFKALPRLHDNLRVNCMRDPAPNKRLRRFYEPVDFSLEMAHLMGGYQEVKNAPQDHLTHNFAKVQNYEKKRIALQSALLQIFIETPDKEIESLNFSKVAGDKDFNDKTVIFHDIRRIKALVNHPDFLYNPETGRYRIKSGLHVKPAHAWNTMSLTKHLSMRASPVYEFSFRGQQYKGKIYADFLDSEADVSRRVLIEAKKAEGSVDVESAIRAIEQADRRTHQQSFFCQKNLFEHAFRSMIAMAIDESEPTDCLRHIESRPEGSASSIIRPRIVEWADDDASEGYVARARFNDGALLLELPPATIKQYEECGIPIGECQSLVFVQDLDGNIKLTRHKDTHFHHSTPNGGRAVRTAGEMLGTFTIENQGSREEKVVYAVHKIDNKSGHYWPKVATMGHFRDDLIASGLDGSKLKFESVQPNDAVNRWNGHSHWSQLPRNDENAASYESDVEELKQMLLEEQPAWESSVLH